MPISHGYMVSPQSGVPAQSSPRNKLPLLSYETELIPTFRSSVSKFIASVKDGGSADFCLDPLGPALLVCRLADICMFGPWACYIVYHVFCCVV